MSDLYDYLGFAQVSNGQVVVYICIFAGLCFGWVWWHAKKRLKVSKDALRETEWPNR